MGRLDKLKKKSAARTEAMDEAQNRMTAQAIVKRVNDVEPERLDLNMIVANPDNELYRTDDTEEEIKKLADNIRMVGLLHNLVVCKCEDGENKGKYELLSGERRFKALNYLVRTYPLDDNAPDWNRPYCIKLEGLSDVEKVVYLDTANLMVRGGFGNEKIARKATVRFVENLQKPPFNMTESEAKKQLKELSPMKPRTIDKGLSIEKNLLPELKDLLDNGIITRNSAESYVNLTLAEQKAAAEAFVLAEKIEPLSQREKAKKQLADSLRDVLDSSDLTQRTDILSSAKKAVEELCKKPAPTQKREKTSYGRDSVVIGEQVPAVTKKLKRLAKAFDLNGGLDIILARSVEERETYIQNLDDLIELATSIKQDIQSTM
ncbi:ParB/RepB/Spo0J family partition protein [Gemmiger sp.]